MDPKEFYLRRKQIEDADRAARQAAWMQAASQFQGAADKFGGATARWQQRQDEQAAAKARQDSEKAQADALEKYRSEMLKLRKREVDAKTAPTAPSAPDPGKMITNYRKAQDSAYATIKKYAILDPMGKVLGIKDGLGSVEQEAVDDALAKVSFYDKKISELMQYSDGQPQTAPVGPPASGSGDAGQPGAGLDMGKISAMDPEARKQMLAGMSPEQRAEYRKRLLAQQESEELAPAPQQKEAFPHDPLSTNPQQFKATIEKATDYKVPQGGAQPLPPAGMPIGQAGAIDRAKRGVYMDEKGIKINPLVKMHEDEIQIRQPQRQPPSQLMGQAADIDRAKEGVQLDEEGIKTRPLVQLHEDEIKFKSQDTKNKNAVRLANYMAKQNKKIPAALKMSGVGKGMEQRFVEQAWQEEVYSLLENVSDQVGRNLFEDLTVTSGKRTHASNKAAGGVKKSYHLEGYAVDLDVSKLTDAQRSRLIGQAKAAGMDAIYHDAGSGLHLHLEPSPDHKYSYQSGYFDQPVGDE